MTSLLRFGCALVLLIVVSCSPATYLRTAIRESEKDFKDHTGFMLYDPESGRTLFQYQHDRYFTPASNTKIFTLFASFQLLGDSIPSLYYKSTADTLTIWGTGDPSFLYTLTHHNDRVIRFLRERPEPIAFSASNFMTDHFGPGWAWDDQLFTYQVERSALPLYGNRFTLTRNGESFHAAPPVLSDPSAVREDYGDMLPTLQKVKGKRDTWEVPFHVSTELTARLLSDTLLRPVTVTNKILPADRKVLMSIPADSLYRVMMQESDNFIAEQLLLLCSGVLSDTLKPEIGIREVKKRWLADLPDTPVWVDGSGLSRYNLFTPRDIVMLWDKMYKTVPRERLFPLLAQGGAGTLKNYFKSPSPYIFGKTGTLSNNHSLSGYLTTKKGKTWIFCWMNSNYPGSTAPVRARMEKVLKEIYERY